MDAHDRPNALLEFAYFPRWEDHLTDLAHLAEEEDWEYHRSPSPRPLPILYNYLRYTYVRLAEEGKITVSTDEQWACLNTGLVTPSQEAIFMLFDRNIHPNQQFWHFDKFRRKGEWQLNPFASLPDMAHYFDDPSKLVFDCRKELRANIEHIIADNKQRFPAPYSAMDDYPLQTFLKGSIDNAKERVRRNYKAAIPQYYNGSVQLLLPLCISSPGGGVPLIWLLLSKITGASTVLRRA